MKIFQKILVICIISFIMFNNINSQQNLNISKCESLCNTNKFLNVELPLGRCNCKLYQNSRFKNQNPVKFESDDSSSNKNLKTLDEVYSDTSVPLPNKFKSSVFGEGKSLFKNLSTFANKFKKTNIIDQKSQITSENALDYWTKLQNTYHSFNITPLEQQQKLFGKKFFNDIKTQNNSTNLQFLIQNQRMEPSKTIDALMDTFNNTLNESCFFSSFIQVALVTLSTQVYSIFVLSLTFIISAFAAIQSALVLFQLKSLSGENPAQILVVLKDIAFMLKVVESQSWIQSYLFYLNMIVVIFELKNEKQQFMNIMNIVLIIMVIGQLTQQLIKMRLQSQEQFFNDDTYKFELACDRCYDSANLTLKDYVIESAMKNHDYILHNNELYRDVNIDGKQIALPYNDDRVKKHDIDKKKTQNQILNMIREEAKRKGLEKAVNIFNSHKTEESQAPKNEINNQEQ